MPNGTMSWPLPHAPVINWRITIWARCLMSWMQMPKASEYYTQAPNIPDAHYNLARIRELQGDEVSALRHMRNYRDIVDAGTDD